MDTAVTRSLIRHELMCILDRKLGTHSPHHEPGAIKEELRCLIRDELYDAVLNNVKLKSAIGCMIRQEVRRVLAEMHEVQRVTTNSDKPVNLAEQLTTDKSVTIQTLSRTVTEQAMRIENLVNEIRCYRRDLHYTTIEPLS